MKWITALKKKPDILILAIVFLVLLVVTISKSINRATDPKVESQIVESREPEQDVTPAPVSPPEPEPVVQTESPPEPAPKIPPEPEPEPVPKPQLTAPPKTLAIDDLRQCADQGNGECQLELANRHVLGKDVAQDFEQSVKWYRLAADQGLPVAQFNLGNAYQRGRGVEKNVESAKRYWARAAKQGLAAAQLNLGIRLVEERGVDDELGLTLIKAAADQGHPSARQTLKQIADYKASLLKSK